MLDIPVHAKYNLFQHQAFTYIQNIMTAEEFTFEEKVKVQKEALSHIQVWDWWYWWQSWFIVRSACIRVQ